MLLWKAEFEMDGIINFRQLVPLLTNKDISLVARGDCIAVVCEVECCMEVRPGL